MAIRPAHTVQILQKRLKDAEMSDLVDAMELVGIYDELARVERKWLEKANDVKVGKRSTRPLSDVDQMNDRFDRLRRLIEAALRKGVADLAEKTVPGKSVPPPFKHANRSDPHHHAHNVTSVARTMPLCAP